MYPPSETKILKFGKKNEPFWWEKIGKGVNKVKLAILSQSELLFLGKKWEKLKIDQNWPFLVNLSHFGCKIDHCDSF